MFDGSYGSYSTYMTANVQFLRCAVQNNECRGFVAGLWRDEFDHEFVFVAEQLGAGDILKSRRGRF